VAHMQTASKSELMKRLQMAAALLGQYGDKHTKLLSSQSALREKHHRAEVGHTLSRSAYFTQGKWEGCLHSQPTYSLRAYLPPESGLCSRAQQSPERPSYEETSKRYPPAQPPWVCVSHTQHTTSLSGTVSPHTSSVQEPSRVRRASQTCRAVYGTFRASPKYLLPTTPTR